MVDEISYQQEPLADAAFFRAASSVGASRRRTPRPRRRVGQTGRASGLRIPESERLGALAHIAEIRAVLAASRTVPGEDGGAATPERRAG